MIWAKWRPTALKTRPNPSLKLLSSVLKLCFAVLGALSPKRWPLTAKFEFRVADYAPQSIKRLNFETPIFGRALTDLKKGSPKRGRSTHAQKLGSQN